MPFVCIPLTQILLILVLLGRTVAYEWRAGPESIGDHMWSLLSIPSPSTSPIISGLNKHQEKKQKVWGLNLWQWNQSMSLLRWRGSLMSCIQFLQLWSHWKGSGHIKSLGKKDVFIPGPQKNCVWTTSQFSNPPGGMEAPSPPKFCNTHYKSLVVKCVIYDTSPDSSLLHLHSCM